MPSCGVQSSPVLWRTYKAWTERCSTSRGVLIDKTSEPKIDEVAIIFAKNQAGPISRPFTPVTEVLVYP
ncbi:hypothetical protein DACRYDRAFT_22391 [Dacryopinax primogenitus]|uniref:Uncharacterized protein n=1 Tax=Dacryopinax primogenitus (strain DJM 731) TaxID=1858805 RepID=M5G1B7_DACPD|nr:uncharacterized protein DACRYDRAFT_22391 [Dacryopinax primogenitus]EJU01985.1 hypothetical protein DACRYDRAFT_22391 [Dacryopinax primogenitus]